MLLLLYWRRLLKMMSGELEDYYDLAIHDKDFVLVDSFEHEPAVDEDFDELDNVD